MTGARGLDRRERRVRVDMAGAGAVAQLADGVLHIAVLGVRTGRIVA